MAKLVVCIFLFLAVNTHAQVESIESGWKGIKVFVSTRDDVEKLYGSSSTKAGGTIYQTADGNIDIVYSRAPCSDLESFSGSYSLPTDHILEFTVYLKTAIPIEDLNWAKNRYLQDISGSHRNITSYYSVKDGTRIVTKLDEGKEMVVSISYRSTNDQERAYLCRVGSKKYPCLYIAILADLRQDIKAAL